MKSHPPSPRHDAAPALVGAEAAGTDVPQRSLTSSASVEKHDDTIASASEVSSDRRPFVEGDPGAENAVRLFNALVAADREPELQAEILSALSPADFKSPWHGQLWVKARTIAASARAVDCVSLAEGLAVTEAHDLARLVSGAVTSATWENSAAAVRTDAKRRRMLADLERAESRIAKDDPAEVAREQAESFAAEADAGADGPEFATLGSLPSVADGDPAELIRSRFLCRGCGCLLIGQTGYGKSSLILQLATAFTLGRPTLGLTPARALRCLIVQAENDNGDLAEVRDGLRCGLPQAGVGTLAEVDAALARLPVLTVDTVSGDRFPPFLARALSRCPEGMPDLVFVDPLLAFYGGDTSDQEGASAWLRAGLNPILHRTGAALVLVHHTPKPASLRNQDPSREPHDLDYAYLGLGSVEWPGWARATLSLQAVKGADGIFMLRAGKRGRHLGWADADGTATVRRFIAHAKERGPIYWREPDASEIPEPEANAPGRKPRHEGDYVDSLIGMVKGSPLPLAEALARLQADYGLGVNKARRVIALAGDRLQRVQLQTDRRYELVGLPGETTREAKRIREAYQNRDLEPVK